MTKIYSSMPSTPDIPGLTKKIQAVLESGQLTNNGPVVKRLEGDIIPAMTGKNYVSLVANGTQALELALACYPAKFAIVPSYTFAATALAARNANKQVLLADVDSSGLLSKWSVERVIEMIPGRIKDVVVVGVDLFSQCFESNYNDYPDYDLVIDSAHSFGLKFNGLVNCCHTRAYSFHATKLIHSLEGGCVVSRNLFAQRAVLSLRNFGFYSDSISQMWNKVEDVSTNAKMDEVRATILEHNIKYLTTILHHNCNLIEQVYKPLLGDLVKDYNDRYALVKITDTNTRQRLLSELHRNDIYLRNYFKPLHMQKQFQHMVVPGLSYRTSESLDSAFISLPLGLSVSREMAEKTANICMEVLG